MERKSKTSKATPIPAAKATKPVVKAPVDNKVVSKKAVTAKAPAAPAVVVKPVEKPVAKKTPAKVASESAITAVKAPKVAPITFEELTMRAYFVSETRQKLGLPGTPEQDWLEAERLLTEEAFAQAKGIL